jgi:hypothetical protein
MQVDASAGIDDANAFDDFDDGQITQIAAPDQSSALSDQNAPVQRMQADAPADIDDANAFDDFDDGQITQFDAPNLSSAPSDQNAPVQRMQVDAPQATYDTDTFEDDEAQDFDASDSHAAQSASVQRMQADALPSEDPLTGQIPAQGKGKRVQRSPDQSVNVPPADAVNSPESIQESQSSDLYAALQRMGAFGSEKPSAQSDATPSSRIQRRTEYPEEIDGGDDNAPDVFQALKAVGATTQRVQRALAAEDPSPNSDNVQSDAEAEDVDISKLADDVYRVLQNRLRQQMDRRSRR